MRIALVGSRGGFTIVELFVSIGVIAVLLSLLLPAVQKSREVSRGIQCLANLKGLAAATEAYAVALGRYPGLQRVGEQASQEVKKYGFVKTPHPRESTQSRLLPYLEFAELYSQLEQIDDFSELGEPPQSRFNEFALRHHISVFICLSDSVPKGGNSYRGCMGPTTGVHGTWAKGMAMLGTIDMEGLSGIFQSDSFGPRDVRDGISQTMLFSERVVGDGDAKSYFPFRDLAGLDGQYFYRPNDAVIGCAGFIQPNQNYSYLGHTWVLPIYAHTCFNQVLTPNSRIPDCMDSTGDQFSQGAMTARSMHSGGVNVVFADGAGRFISESIDLKVWRALGSINGGEVIDEF